MNAARPAFFRRLLQFRLRTLLLLVFVIAAYLGWRYYDYPSQLPLDWKVGEFDRRTGAWDNTTSQNIKWSSKLGPFTRSSPVVSGGKVFIGTDNGFSSVPRLGVLLCFNAEDGEFLWKASSESPPAGHFEDVCWSGVNATPLVAGNRLWYVNTRAEVVCLDTEGFYDKENDGVVQNEVAGTSEADVVWTLDMRAALDVHPHRYSLCQPATDGERLFVVTGNAFDQGDLVMPNPSAPSFIALDRQTGKILWSDNSPGSNVLHQPWGSPTYAVIGGVPQVIFPGGDGWLYSFDPAGTANGKSKLLWKFDLNPKSAVHAIGGRGTKREAFHVTVTGDRVFAVGGQDFEQDVVKDSILWCLDGTKRGDVSAELAVNRQKPTEPLLPRRMAAIDPTAGEIAVANPNSAVIWKFDKFDFDGNGGIEFEETMHSVRAGVVVKDGVLLVVDFSGLVHCFDAQTGQRKWAYDTVAGCYATPLIVGRHAYVCDDDGVAIFELWSAKRGITPPSVPIAEINMGRSCYGAPTASRGVLFIASQDRLFAIEEEQK